MSWFYGSLQGSRGEATRAGSKQSGYRAWAQNMTSRVIVDFQHNEEGGRDLVDVLICRSTQNYNSGMSGTALVSDVDIDAIINSMSWDAATKRHLNAARGSIQKANEAAIKAEAKRQKLMEKTYGKAS